MEKDRHECDAGIPTQRASHVTTTLKTVRLTFNKSTSTGRPEKKRKRERWMSMALLGSPGVGAACRVPLRGRYEFELGRVDYIVPERPEGKKESTVE